MSFGFLLLTPALLNHALEKGTTEKSGTFVRLGSCSEMNDTSDAPNMINIMVGTTDVISTNTTNEEKIEIQKKTKNKNKKENSNNDSSYNSSNNSNNTIGNVETVCTLAEMGSIHKWHYWIEKCIGTFVLATAVFTVIAIQATISHGASTQGNRHTNGSVVPNYKNQKDQGGSSSKMEPHHWVEPEPIGYGFIFHVSFLLPMFMLHGLWTGSLMTLRVGILFSLSVAIVMPTIGTVWYSELTLWLSICSWFCCVAATMLFASGSLYYFFLSNFIKAKSSSVSNAKSSLTKVFGPVRRR